LASKDVGFQVANLGPLEFARGIEEPKSEWSHSMYLMKHPLFILITIIT